jgi:Fur family transcriptional regulator, peroxide stress response regulator
MTAEHTDSFLRLARECGLKVTPQRVQIYSAFADKHAHPSAEEVHQDVRRNLPSISLDTVYRTLATLADHGILDRVYSDELCTRFEIHSEPHHHFICLRCNTIQDVQWPEFDRLPLPRSITDLGKSIVTRIELRGVCDSCSKDDKMASE